MAAPARKRGFSVVTVAKANCTIHLSFVLSKRVHSLVVGCLCAPLIQVNWWENSLHPKQKSRKAQKSFIQTFDVCQIFVAYRCVTSQDTEMDQTAKRSLRNPNRLKVFDKRTDYCIYLPIWWLRCKQIPFPNPFQTWLVKIRRDASKDFKLTRRTKICSLHFKDSDFRLTLKGRRYIKDDALPSIFPWSVSSPNRKSPRKR